MVTAFSFLFCYCFWSYSADIVAAFDVAILANVRIIYKYYCNSSRLKKRSEFLAPSVHVHRRRRSRKPGAQPGASKKNYVQSPLVFVCSVKKLVPPPSPLNPIPSPPLPKAKAKAKAKKEEFSIIPSDPSTRKCDDPPETIDQRIRRLEAQICRGNRR